MAGARAEFVHDNLRLVGSSLAGEETYIVAPELNLAFDVGRCPAEVLNVDHVFLTHGHMDHAAGVAYYFSQRMFLDNTPGHLYAPRPLIEPLRRLLRVWADIDGHEPPSNLHAAEPGVDIELRRDLLVRPFVVNHPCRRHDRTVVPALGFTAIEVRQKLRPEYQNLTGPQLVALKQQGVAITRRVELPLVTYCGDTAVGDFFELDFVRTSRVLLLECTFVEPDHIDRARAGFHMHIRDLGRVIPALACERIVLVHLSRRTPSAVARAMVQRELGEHAARVVFLMDYRRRRRGPDAPPSATISPT